MKKTAEIVSIRGNIVRVKVERSSMCDGCAVKAQNGKCSCSHASLLGEAKLFFADAVCDIPVSIGDKVIIETADSKVLRNAVLVFILPIVFFIAANSLTLHFTDREAVSFASAAAAFLLSFVVIGIAEKKKKDKLPDITVTEVVSSLNSK